jgi:imidazolonepropionase-like amidohydrolase
MKTTCILALLVLLLPSDLAIAQNLVITNGHIIDGTGRTINRGTIVIREGRIASVSDAAVDTPGTIVIDVQGMTVMPGLIDTHRHDLSGV